MFSVVTFNALGTRVVCKIRALACTTKHEVIYNVQFKKTFHTTYYAIVSFS